MKAPHAVAFLMAALLVIGCGPDNVQSPDLAQQQTDAISPLSKSGGQPQFYSFSGTDDLSEGFLNLVKINPRTGSATTIWKIGVANTATEIVSPFGLAFDVDGTMYAFICWIDVSFVPGTQKSKLARIDMGTGAVTYIGDYIALHFAGPDIDANGNLYVTGFTVGDPAGGPPLIFGDDILYRVDKVTGIPTAIGHTGRTDWMDLAFDSHGRLWATVSNKLYQFNTQTGASTFITDIVGVPQSNVPGVPPEDWPYLEVMTIAFDANDVLYATTIRGFSASLGNATVLKIDTETGQATLVGYTGKSYNHGGDIMPTRVRICHKLGNGKYNSMTIAMDALPAHLAHGDIVPGAAGNSCSCP